MNAPAKPLSFVKRLESKQTPIVESLTPQHFIPLAMLLKDIYGNSGLADSADEVLKVLASQNQTLKGVLNIHQDRLSKYANPQDSGAVDLDLIFMKPNLSSEIQSDRAAQRVQLKAFSDEKNKQMAYGGEIDMGEV